jgi:teichuronic acid biosynthesis glycosyltransferase TuaC
MRVLVLASLYPHAQNETLGLSTHRRTVELAKRCPVKVVALTGRADLPEREEYGGVEVLRPRWRRIPKLGVFLDGYRYAARVAKALAGLRAEFDFDLIDAHWLYPDAFAAVRLGQRLGKPVVVTGRGSDVDEFLFRWPVRRFARAALRGAAQLVALTRRHKERMIDAGAEAGRIAVVPNGVDTALFCPGDRAEARQALGLPPDGVVLLSAGSIVHDKGYHHLIRGLATLAGEARLYIAGPGDYRGALERLAHECGIVERVTFLGRVAQGQMPLWYQAADLFCFGSYHEGCPNAVLEALACGTPVVSTNVGGIPDLVEEGRSGVLFTPRSDEAFAAALRMALGRPWDRAEIAALGARRSWAHVAAEYLALFERLMAGKR